MAARDTQRKRLYDAERTILAWGRCKGDPLSTVEECQAFVDKVMASRWVATRWRRKVTVRPGHGHTRATGSPTSGIIQLPTWSRFPLVILHELAHVLNTTSSYAPHGPEFAGLYAALVERHIGVAAATELRAAFKTHRVRSNLKAVPAPRYGYVPKATIVAAARAKANRTPSTGELGIAADVIRRAAKAGLLGPSGRAKRTHAAATARALEALTDTTTYIAASRRA